MQYPNDKATEKTTTKGTDQINNILHTTKVEKELIKRQLEKLLILISFLGFIAIAECNKSANYKDKRGKLWYSSLCEPIITVFHI